MSHHHNQSPTADDLLSFKEFEPVHESYSRGGSARAEININSPKRDLAPQRPTMATSAAGGSGGATAPSAFDENFQSLLDDMSTSVNMLDGGTDTRTSAGRSMPQSTSASTSLDVDNDGADGANDAKPAPGSFSFLSIEYYQQFFDVDTGLVLERIANSMIPRRAPGTYLRQNIGQNPDLYGPFWIVVTLVFCIAISGNVASYMQYASSEYHWRYNFHLVSTAATTIVLYVCLMPVGLWAAFKWFVRPADPDIETESPYIPGLLTLICLYGYSLVIYIPVSILWVIQVSVLQWLLVLSATFLSGSVLVLVLSPALRVSRGSLAFAAGIVAGHFLLAAGFMLYFFHVPESVAAPPQSVPPAAVRVVAEAVNAVTVAAAKVLANGGAAGAAGAADGAAVHA